MKIFGVDIGTYSIKITEALSSGKKLQVTNFYKWNLDLDISKDSSVQILEILRNFFQQHCKEEDYIALGINENNVIHHTLTFPFKEKLSILRSLPFELEDEIPVSSEKSAFEGKILYYEGKSTHVLSSILRKEFIKDLLSKCHEYGANVNLLSSNGLVLSNFFEKWDTPIKKISPPQSQHGKVLIDLGHSQSTVLIFHESILVEIISIHWGGKDFIENIQKHYNTSLEEAIKAMEDKAFILMSHEGAEKAHIIHSELLEKTLEPFLRQLELLFLELKSNKNLNVESIHLCGNLSQIKSLTKYMNKKLNLPVENLVVDNEKIIFKTNPYPVSIGAVSLGLCIESFKKSYNPVTNFLKGEFLQRGRSFSQFFEAWKSPLVLGLTTFVLFTAFSVSRYYFTEKISDNSQQAFLNVGKKVTGISSRRGADKKIKKFISSNQKSLEAKKYIEDLKQNQSPLKVLKTLSNGASSSDVAFDIKTLRIKGNDIILKGLIKDKKSVSALKTNLKKSFSIQKEEILDDKTNKDKKLFSFFLKLKK